MGLLARLRGDGGAPERKRRELAADARAMRVALSAMHAELQRVNGVSAPVDLRAIVRDLLEGEVEAPTADVASLVRAELDPDEFYDKELRPSWEELDESHRATRVEGFIELSRMVEAPSAAAGLPEDMIPRVHTKTLLLAWAFDETYGYLSALGRGEE